MPISNGADAGRIGGSSGNRPQKLKMACRCSVLVRILALGLLIQGLGVSAARAQGQSAPAVPPATPPTNARSSQRTIEFTATTDRDSLMTEIKTYSQLIRSLRDSLSQDGSILQLSEGQRDQLEGNIAEISGVIDRISTELSRLEFEIKDNRISLVNEAGEGIVINVPQDLDKRVSEGIEAITKVILSELPDSVDFDHSKKWDWNRFRPEPPPPPRRIINGNIIKVWNDVHISAKEDVRGDVVVIFGNAEVSGRVDGSVVTVFGDLLLDETAEVTGTVVAVGGYLDQDPEAQVDDVVSIDPLKRGRGEGWVGIFRHDGLSFLVAQGMFLLTLMLAIVAVSVAPQARLQNIIGTVRSSAVPSFGMGVITALAGHVVVAILIAVLVLTVIGVPLALLVGLVLLVVVVLAVTVCGVIVGERLCARLGGRCRSPWLVAVVGMSALHLVSFIGSLLGLVGGLDAVASLVVVLGLLIKIVAYLVGLGALVLSRFGQKPSAA